MVGVAIPEEIGSATSLVKFDCSSNHIKELPSSLGKCSDLSDLKASNNLIYTLPEDLMNCSKLKKTRCGGKQANNFIREFVRIVDNAYKIQCIKEFAEWYTREHWMSFASHPSLPSSEQNFANPTINSGLLFPSGILYGVIFLSTVYRMFIYLAESFALLMFIWYLLPQIFRNNALSMLLEELGVLSRLGTLDLHSNHVAISISSYLM
ncbi:hypothetical protein REPUB_Repub11eG0062900 [Reevesia pubescens]